MTSMNDILKGGRPKRKPEHDGSRHGSLPERDAPGSGVLAGVDRRPDGTPTRQVIPNVRIKDIRKGNTRFYTPPPEEPEADDLRKLRAQAQEDRELAASARRQAEAAAKR
jgi:hypothetical protein